MENNLFALADGFVREARENLWLDARDELFVKNRVLEILTEADGVTCEEVSDKIYGVLTPLPSAIDARFQALLKESPKRATDWFYDLCVKNGYVKRALLDKNPRFEGNGLIVTINKAKPEFRDPKKAASGNAVAGGYPACSICRENEGFGGRSKRTLRTVNLTLDGGRWFWQYSPYGYFHEHGIAVNCEHTPMRVDERTFYRLMDFVDIFPHYFIGCNAPLPRIGGSVLAHDHYQGGGEILPMHRAKAAYTVEGKTHKDAVVEVLDWAGTVVRVVSKNRRAVAEIGWAIAEKWRTYENRDLGIIPEDKDGVHNAVSPTVLKTERGYEMSVILRSNVTSARYPDGVFHAHPEFHAIKKESIGLIEAQGLFILPGRLEAELSEIEQLVSSGRPLPAEKEEYRLVYEEVKAMGGDVHAAMKRELGSVCGRILENTAVFKDKRQTLEFLNGIAL